MYPYYQASEPATTVTEAERQRRRVWKGIQKLENEWPPVDAAMTLRAESKCLRACDSRAKVKTCVEIKILRRVRTESSRRPPRHRRDD